MSQKKFNPKDLVRVRNLLKLGEFTRDEIAEPLNLLEQTLNIPETVEVAEI
ncbi:MAG: hypothetical protein ACTSYU_12775 [Promethearchaeota archaeon]